ncbi:acetyltransferase, ribosomal protein N-acetylase [Halovivax ruber XH-70]|uniref:Acetyltransferase, ribosomal protein N-acetylase n=1 Tax=Halovivax ruber (strain DSM 18193 / JCM 13892 / XH-70) TaxID=797302 RepID=L0IFV3_HALRX|nr:GNAT family protein [Halovivax ruber]AGB17723.1 acetyltransferase, ribosomal protein N-acetylase [Halovivax ruber XH-70]
MPGHVFLEGERIEFRVVENAETDRRVLGYVRNEPGFRQALGFDTPWPSNRTESFIESVTNDESSCNLLVCLRDDGGSNGADDWNETDRGSIVGAVSLFDIDRVSGTLSYWLLPDYRGEGYATEAVSVLCNYAVRELGLHRIQADVFDENDASRRLLERLGFVHEGTKRECRVCGGEYRGVDQYAILDEEWNREEKS